MATLYYLDPRQAGTGAAPDVKIHRIGDVFYLYYPAPKGARTLWRSPRGSRSRFTDEQSALAAARQAAGFGHVAEEPCAQWLAIETDERRAREPETCADCAWSRDAHGKEG
jgi:hypothetical protein